MRSPPRFGNLFGKVRPTGDDEQSDFLVQSRSGRIERIVSHGHRSPDGFWYDQEEDEWVLLVSGSAKLQIEGEAEPRALGPGDWMLIPAHLRHRVVWTDPQVDTIWLAVWQPVQPRT